MGVISRKKAASSGEKSRCRIRRSTFCSVSGKPVAKSSSRCRSRS